MRPSRRSTPPGRSATAASTASDPVRGLAPLQAVLVGIGLALLLPVVATAQASHGTAPTGAPPPAHGTADTATAQPSADHAPASAGQAAVAEGHGEEAEHGESVWSFIARILNFVLLAGGLYYLLRTPLANYLDARSRQIRSDLDHAARTREESKARLAEIDTRLKALPAEIDALRARGRREIEVEEERIRRTAEAERARLVEQTGREIDRQVQIARRDLTEHAANLAIDVARRRLAGEMTDADQLRLVDRYVKQVGTVHD